ncbi:pimeloyl-ACP methyl ester carboxylesterase [Nakamurella sp. UYEF19]|uniref:alpha/beta fold hydrolase n=1 Tax=Nakamurella sp. UYEF19 TaxID=1756392 RepID=UPI003398DF42
MRSTKTRHGSQTGRLDYHDRLVVAAELAERGLYEHYQLEPTHHMVALSRLDIQVRVTQIGSGPPVLIVPGNTGDGFPFAPLIPHLPGRRVIILNRPGGGLSEGMDHRSIGFRDLAGYTLSTVLDSLGLEQVPIIAHSMGGHWSQWFAMDYPQRVSALALLGVPGNVLTTQPPLTLRLASVRGLNRLVVPATIPRTVDKALSGMRVVGHSAQNLARLPAAMGECYFAFDRLPHYQMSTRTLMEVTNRLRGSKPDVRITQAQLESIHTPATLLWGQNDPFGDVQTGRRIAELLGGRFTELPGGGHLPWLDDAETAGGLVMELLHTAERSAHDVP